MNQFKIVDFHKYCEKCKFKNVKQDSEPCNECLYSPARIDSYKPINFKENKENKVEKNERKTKKNN